MAVPMRSNGSSGRSLRSVVDMQALGNAPSFSIAMCCKPMAARAPPPSPGLAWPWPLPSGGWSSSTLKKLPLTQLVAATSVGIVEGMTLLDLAYEEDSQADVDMNVVMTESGGLVEIQATAERSTFAREKLLGDDGSRRAGNHRTGGGTEGGAGSGMIELISERNLVTLIML